MKDLLTVGHPGFSGYVGNWVVAMNDKYGWDNYFKKFAANNPKIGRSVFDATTDIVSGERVVGPGADSLALERKAGGNSITISFPEDDTILVTAPVTVMKEAPHPNAARLLMNFYYSKEYSTTAASTFNLPLRLDVPLADRRARRPDAHLSREDRPAAVRHPGSDGQVARNVQRLGWRR